MLSKIIKVEMKVGLWIIQKYPAMLVLGFLETVYGSLVRVWVCIRVYVYVPTKCFHIQHMHTYTQIKKCLLF